jgi:pSer/pThr/pTyr-binding forkhead associated (FHA) protein
MAPGAPAPSAAQQAAATPGADPTPAPPVGLHNTGGVMSNVAPSAAVTVPRPPVEPIANLVVIAKDGGEGPKYPVLDQVEIGRTMGGVRFPDDRYLAQRHVRLFGRDGKLVLRDLESPNGVYLRLRGQDEAQLQNLSLFLIGQQVLRFELLDAAAKEPMMEGDTLLFGTPAATRYARICQRTVEGLTLDIYHLRKLEMTFGRESGDVVFSDDPFLSRRHAAVRFDETKKAAFVRDLGSSNGTYIRMTTPEVELQHGDQFRIGQQLFRVDLGRAGLGPDKLTH